MRAALLTALACLMCLAAGCDPTQPAETGGPSVCGRVLVPKLTSTTTSGGGNDAGEAPAERGEVPAREVTVTVAPAGGGEPVGSTETDAKGNWCVEIGGEQLGMDLVATARVDGIEFRRPLLVRDNQVISVRSEAVWQMLQEQVDDPARVSAARFLNLEAMVSTATDLLEPVDWREVETFEGAVEQTVGRARKDERVAEALKTLGKR